VKKTHRGARLAVTTIRIALLYNTLRSIIVHNLNTEYEEYLKKLTMSMHVPRNSAKATLIS